MGTGSDPASVQIKAQVLIVAGAQHQESARIQPEEKEEDRPISEKSDPLSSRCITILGLTSSPFTLS